MGRYDVGAGGVGSRQKNEAEELFKKMEDKVHKAKTVEFESELVSKGPRREPWA